jgi:putative ABC transport system substrate-binding protein
VTKDQQLSGSIKKGLMVRKFPLWLTLILFLTNGSLAHAQQPGKIPKIGLLRARTAASGTALERLIQELRKLGYVGGKNISFESRSAEGKPDRLPGLAEELIRIKVDVIVAAATSEALAAKNATTTTPIVFLAQGDPVAAGLVASLARPGGNVTGFASIGSLAGKRLELLKETVPKLNRVAVLWNPKDTTSAQQWEESQLAARDLKLQLHSMAVSAVGEFDSVFKEAIKSGSAALSVGGGAIAISNQKQIADLAVKYRLPAIYSRNDYIANGGLMAYGGDQAEPYRRVAVMIDKILKGSKPSDIPVEQPTKFEFVINLKTAKQIRLTIPPEVLARADRVIR